MALDLAGGELKLFADARVDEDAVTLSALRAGLGAGTLTAEGKLGLKDTQPFSFKGKLANFDPARLAKVAPGRINADFSTTGSLAKVLRVALDFGLHESEYRPGCRRPAPARSGSRASGCCPARRPC